MIATRLNAPAPALLAAPVYIAGLTAFVLLAEGAVAPVPWLLLFAEPSEPLPTDEGLADEPLPDEPLPDEPLPDEPLPDEPLPDEPLPADEGLLWPAADGLDDCGTGKIVMFWFPLWLADVVVDGFDAAEEDRDETVVAVLVDPPLLEADALLTVVAVLVDPPLLEADALLTVEVLALELGPPCDADELDADLEACPTGILELDDGPAGLDKLEVGRVGTDDDDTCAGAELEGGTEAIVDPEVTGQTVVPTETTLVTVTVDCMLAGQLTTAAAQLVMVEVCVE
ncbi:MAG: hypothetical protein M1812_005677 [Candelaria pacifica]|nr:MAG: hypothetical protein M1812_005677 [Candelaria pacifica]